jgi:hypothetical protein
MFIPILSGQIGNKTKVTVVDMAKSFSKQQEVPLSRFVDDIKYVPLETNPETIIGNYPLIEVTAEHVIVRQIGAGGKFQILLFDRETGKFLREIGKQGRGPGEFSIWSPVPFNSAKKLIYAINTSSELLAYDLSGKVTDKIKIPEWVDPKMPKMTKLDNQRILITADNMLDDNIFVGYVVNNSGWEKRRLALFSKGGVLKVFPNFQTFVKEDLKKLAVPPLGGLSKFYRWDNRLNFIEAYCDTLYYVTKDELIPRYFFNWGKYNVPYSKQEEIRLSSHPGDYFYIKSIAENNSNIFLQIYFAQEQYTVFVDKKTSLATICKTGASGNSALIDDISGMMEVMPQDFTEKNEMVFVIQPTKLVKWLKENPDKALKARNKLTWLNKIDEFSNPIIAIGKCKD